MNDLDVVVVGGGISGLAHALALALAGRRVRVFERAAEFTEVGAGLQLAPNATRILREWGLLDEVVGRGVLPRRLAFRDALDGSALTHLDLGPEFVQRYGAPYVVIHRSELLAILADACVRAGVDLVAGSHVEHVQATAAGAVAVTGGQRCSADVVVAADGLGSALRRHLSPDEPIDSGYVAYRGAVPTAEVVDALDEDTMRDVVAYLGPRCHLVHYPLRGGAVFNIVAVFASPGYRRGDEEWGGPDELDQAFAGTCAAVRKGLPSLWRDRHWPMYDRQPIDTWVSGRLVLTGDAAHPMLQYLAQGACQAIEDAHCLSTRLTEQPSGPAVDWPETLAAFESARTVRTARVQRTARLWGEIWHCDGLTRTLRNALLQDRDPADHKHVDWLYGDYSASVSDGPSTSDGR
jgi:salicylate hydroxylase